MTAGQARARVGAEANAAASAAERARESRHAGTSGSTGDGRARPDPRPACFTRLSDMIRRDSLRGRWHAPSAGPKLTHSGAPVSSHYWNLSCPLEQAPWSCAHLGIERAAEIAARRYKPSGCAMRGDQDFQFGLAHEVLTRIEGKKVAFVGDSVIGQVFVAVACRILKYLEVSDLGCDGMLCGPMNPDAPGSALKAGSYVRWQDQPSIKGHPLYDFRCYRGRCAHSTGPQGQIESAVLKFAKGTELRLYKSAFELSSTVRKAISEDDFGAGDLVVVNTGAWYSFGAERDLDAQARMMADLVRSRSPQIDSGGAAGAGGSPMALPHMVWLDSSAQHWNTPGGIYNVSNSYSKSADMPLNAEGAACGAWPREVMERTDFRNRNVPSIILQAGIPVLPIWEMTADAADAMPYELPDCSHFCQPGVPDAIGQAVMNFMLYPFPPTDKVAAAFKAATTSAATPLPRSAKVAAGASSGRGAAGAGAFFVLLLCAGIMAVAARIHKRRSRRA